MILPVPPRFVARLAPTILVAASGCSIFTSYPSHTSDARGAFETGRFADAAREYSEDASGGDELLYRLEAATALQAGGAFDESRQEFEKAEAVLKGFEERPDISGRDIAEGVASAVLNDKSLPYDGEGFERVLLNALQAINYVMLGDLDGAVVEVRRGALRQRQFDEKVGESASSAPPANVFAQYLGGALREASGDLENAYVDYRAVHARVPGVALVLRDLERIARATGRDADLEEWRAALASTTASAPAASSGDGMPPPEGAATILVLGGIGTAPVKQSIEIPLPTGHALTKVSVPRYVERPEPPQAFQIVVDGRPVARSELVENVGAVAMDGLDRRLGWIVAKSIARATGRAVATEIAIDALRRHDHDDAATAVAIVATLWNLFVEQADLRSWLTLPSVFHVARADVAPGSRNLRLELLGPDDRLLAAWSFGTVVISPGGFVPISARALRARLYAHLPRSFQSPETLP